MEEFKKTLEAVVVGNLNLYVILSALLLFVILVIVKRFILKLFKRVMERVKLDASIKSFLNASINTVLWIVIILVTVDRLGVPVTSLVAILSVAGVALSLSLQSLLENLRKVDIFFFRHNIEPLRNGECFLDGFFTLVGESVSRSHSALLHFAFLMDAHAGFFKSFQYTFWSIGFNC